ncbi:DUF6551 family protein [Frankia sp. AgW1.1]|uniref:DUF6551 family protein n=1 Tax=Frankia sp. AgW1.1 TaxID=1836971 RepID=UPI001931D1BE|nr:DUF6551 family protein [Frankia sp. AgW1.1]MBL7487130.1 hypothetical protein [Frankia sp. AgW1.1]
MTILASVPDRDSTGEITLEKLPVGKLSFDIRINRDVNMPRVLRIKENFKADALGVITVSKRIGPRGAATYVVIDGQHRVRALTLMGWSKEPVDCRVFHDLDLAGEAQQFIVLNTFAKPTVLDNFRIRVVGGDPLAVEVNKIIEANGLVAANVGTRACRAVRACEDVYTGRILRGADEDPNRLQLTLSTLVGAYGYERDTTHVTLVAGMGMFFARYGDQVIVPSLTEKLAKSGTPGTLIGKAKSLRDSLNYNKIGDATAQIITNIYNSKRRQQLAEWRTAA